MIVVVARQTTTQTRSQLAKDLRSVKLETCPGGGGSAGD